MKGNNILAVILARGGSKRLPRKNVLELAGKPLISYQIENAMDSNEINDLFVSTDDSEIAEIAEECGVKTPFLRDSDFAKDNTSSLDALKDAVKKYEKYKMTRFDYIVLLQPTSPLTKVNSIDAAINKMINLKFDSLISVCRLHKKIDWLGYLDNEKFVNLGLSCNNDEAFSPSGNFYIVERNYLDTIESFTNCGFYIVDDVEAIDIDTRLEFDIANFLMTRFKAKHGL